MKHHIKLAIAFIIFIACSSVQEDIVSYKTTPYPNDKRVYPDEEWTYTAPENFGFSEDNLKEVKSYFKKIGGEALVVIKSGYVIISWGDVEKPIQNRSIRKSYLNALLGIEYDLGNLNLDTTLAGLRIDDIQGLTETEKKATLRNLMSSTSGVFHPGAFESKEQEGARPPRGSFEPGTFFYYNNWDFNAIGHIYTKISNKDIFTTFKNVIADKIGMQDFHLENMKYEFEESKSKFPAYRMKTSSRDDARYGYLFLCKGKWKNEQLISEEWISKSFKTQVNTGDYYYYNYGLMWWVSDKNRMFIARGNSGQYIAIYPEEDMVFVFRADPGSIFNKWFDLRVKPQESFPIINMILSSRTN